MLLKARQEIIDTPAMLYRVGKRLGHDGLWYDSDGKQTGLIHKLTEGNAGKLPMGVHPIFRSDGYKWISTTDSIDMLKHWFSLKDMQELLQQDYQIMQIEVSGYRRFDFEVYSHEVCSAHQVLDVTSLDPTILYPELKR